MVDGSPDAGIVVAHASALAGLALGLRDPRVRLPAGLFALSMAMLSLERLAILLTMSGQFAGASAGEVLESFLVGLRFDAAISCMLVVPVAAVALVPTRVLLRRWVQGLLAGGCAVILAAEFLLCVVDFFFFQQFGERLNHKALAYLEYDYVYKIIWQDYPVVTAVLLVVAAMGALWWLVRRAAFVGAYRRTGDGPRRPPPRVAPWRLLGWSALLGALLALGIRGSLGPKGINTGPAYFSSRMPLAQLTLNGPFTLREAAFSALVRNRDLGECLPLLSQQDAVATTVQLLRRPEDRFVGHPANPLRRVTDTGRPRRDHNVVLVVLESLSWHYIAAAGGVKGLTPNFDALIAEGTYMDRCFAVGQRTTRGFAGIVSGYPDLPGKSVTTRIEAEGNFLTLGTVLRRRGYETLFIYAGQPMYDHRLSFLGSNGYSRFVFSDQFQSRTFRTHLGYCDGDLFDQADREFAAMGDRPFFATLLTLSFHRDYRVPAGKAPPGDRQEANHDQKNCIRYTDWAIGELIRKARRREYFDRTIFVFVADHMGGYLEHPNTPASFRVPFLVYAPAIVRPRRIETVCSQTDVAPTILSLLGGQYEHCFFGSSVLDRPRETGWAFLQSGSQAVLIDAEGNVATVPFGAPPRLLRYSPPGDIVEQSADSAESAALRAKLARQAVAVLQTAALLFDRGAYNLR